MGTIVSVGYDGKIRAVNEGGWADLSPAASSRPGIVEGCALSIVGNVDRTVRIPSGKLYGWGVLDYLSGNTDLQAAPISSGTRWDTVVLRRDWRPTGSPPVPGGESSLMILTGVSTRAPSALVQNEPGVVADQVLGLIRLQGGVTTIQELLPLGEWPSSLAFRFDTALPNPALFDYGQKIVQNIGPGMGLDIGIRRGGTGTENWDWLLTRDWANLTLAGGYRPFTGRTPQYRVVGDMLQLRGQIERTNGAALLNTYTTVGSVPTSVAPRAWTAVFSASSFTSDTGGGGQCSIAADGVVQVTYPAGKATWGSFDGINIPIG